MRLTYLDYRTPANLMENFRLAWEAEDPSEYRDHILYHSDANEAPDGGHYADFVLYFAEGLDLWGEPLPDSLSYADQVANVWRMFSGAHGLGPHGEEIPGIARVEFSLEQMQAWSDPRDPDHVEGDLYPRGTQRAVYRFEFVVTFKDSIPGSDLTQIAVYGRQELHVIPVRTLDWDGGSHMEYRLWKWRELNLGISEPNLSQIKALY